MQSHVVWLYQIRSWPCFCRCSNKIHVFSYRCTQRGYVVAFRLTLALTQVGYVHCMRSWKHAPELSACFIAQYAHRTISFQNLKYVILARNSSRHRCFEDCMILNHAKFKPKKLWQEWDSNPRPKTTEASSLWIKETLTLRLRPLGHLAHELWEGMDRYQYKEHI